MNGYLLDTHVWLWAQRGQNEKFTPEMRLALEKSQMRNEVCVSAISVLEIARLVAQRRIFLAGSVDEFVAEGTAESGFSLLPLTPRILIESTRLPGEVHRDPSDRLVIATAREHGLTLVTRDRDILAYAKQGHLNARKP